MKKLADITKENSEIIFTDKDERHMRIGDYALPLVQKVFQEMTIKRDDKGVLIYMSKEELYDYQEYKNKKDDDWDLK